MSQYLKLISPLEKEVRRIKECLYPKQIFEVGEEKLIYGTFEESYHQFYIEALRIGNKVNETDFYNQLFSQLELIESYVIGLEKKILLEDGVEVKYHGILGHIFSVKHFLLRILEAKGHGNAVLKFPKSQTKKIFNTYSWKLKDDKMYELKKLLIKAGLISKNTVFQDLKFVFSNKSIEELKCPIVWLTSNATELLFFIKSLMEYEAIEKTKTMNYQLLVRCFVKSDGKNFTESFKSLNTDIDLKISKQYRKKINEVILKIVN